MMKSILLFLIFMSIFPCGALAETDMDLRFKLGVAPGTDRIEFGNTIGHGSNHFGTNAQAEVVLSPHRDSTASFIMGIGLFYRQHPGQIQNLSIPIKIGCSAYGLSMAPGLRIRFNDTWNIELKMEVGVGETDNVTLESPGVNWNATRKDEYKSLSPVLGYYYLFKDSSSRVGLEVGYQKFWGDFEILSNKGEWSGGTVSGVNPTADLIYSIQF